MDKTTVVMFVIIRLAITNAENSLITGRNETFQTEMSSVAFNWTSDKAIDGKIGNDPDTCECCSGTMNSTTSWWTIDLGKMYPLARVIVQGREAENKFLQLKGFRLYLRNSTDQKQQLYYNDGNVLTSDENTTVELNNVLARHVTIERPGILTICEVEVYEGDCRLGSYGEECSKECHCYSTDDGNCNKSTGHCKTPFCKIGWIGPACDTRCATDTFGENCQEKCFCEGNTTCTSDYGNCEGQCRKGYHGIHCNKVCEDGTFGTNCNENCYCAAGNGTCTKDEGICPGSCAEGYKGVHCNEEKSNRHDSVLTYVLCSVGGCVFVVFISTTGLYLFKRHHQSRRTPPENQLDKTTDDLTDKHKIVKKMEKEEKGSNLNTGTETELLLSNLDSNENSSNVREDTIGGAIKTSGPDIGTNVSYAGSSMDVKYTDVFEVDHLYQFYNIAIQTKQSDAEDDECSLDGEEHPYESYDEQYQPLRYFKNWKDTLEVKLNDAVGKLLKDEMNLQEMKFEMITTEASYWKSLKTFIDVFKKSELFRQMETGNDESKRDYKVIFSNIDEIHETSENLLKELEIHWREDIFIPNVCQIVADHLEQHFECYVEYCGNEHRQIKRLEYLCQNNKKFKSDLRELEKERACQANNMSSFINLPMQRITRIRMLIYAIYKQSGKIMENKEETRNQAARALKAANKVVKRCNTTATIKQGEDEINRVATEIEFRNKEISKFEIKQEKRYLVRDEDVTRIYSGKGGAKKFEELRLYIFNDKAVFTKKGKQPPYTVLDYCQLIALKCESVDENNLPKTCLLRVVLLENHKGEKSELMLSCKNQREREEWMKLIAPISDEDETSIYTTLDFPIVRCIKEYTAQRDDELSLQVSDEVKVMRKKRDIYHGERIKDFEEGWFPKTHVEEMRNEHVILRYHLERYLLMRSKKK